MICYKDKTFCDFYKDCKEGDACDDALTDEIKDAAVKWWGNKNAPIARWANKPKCFEFGNKVKDIE